MYRHLYICAAVLAIPPNAPTFAVEAQPVASGPAQSQSIATDQPQLDEIVVTAQRRAESAQNVPIAISALNGNQLASAGVSNTAALQTAVPGLSFNTSLGVNGQPRIRGIGTTANGPGIENPVATYIDGIYQAASPAAIFGLNDVDQVAVLKGPQGTLFGRNATGGLIQVTTRAPSQTFATDMAASYTNNDGQIGNLYVTGGLGRDLAASSAIYYDRLGKGFGTNLVTGQPVQTHENFATREKLVWEPGSDTKITLSGDYSDSTNSDFSVRGLGPTFLGVPTAGGPFDIQSDTQPLAKVKQGGGSLTIQRAMGGAQLVSMSALRYSKFSQRSDEDHSPAPLQSLLATENDMQLSQELQLLSTGAGPFKWVLGGIYFRSVGKFDPLAITAFGEVIDINTRQTLDSLAPFAQASYTFASDTTLTAGLRYTTDRRVIESSTVLRPGIPLTPAYEADKRFNKATWRLAADHRLSPELMMYASYNRGFKSGAFIPYAGVPTELKPEILDALEGGFKADLFDRSVRINASGFYYDYKNTQVTTLYNGLLYLYNASGSRHYGFDIDTTIRPTGRFQLGAGLSYVHARFKSFPNAARSFPITPTFPPPAQSANGGNNIASYDPANPFLTINPGLCFPSGAVGMGKNICDATGNQLQNTPQITFNLNADYDIPTGVGTFTLSGNYYYNDGFFAEVDNRTRQPSYSLFNASLKWTFPHLRYDVKIWGNNLWNKVYAAQLVEGQNGDNRIAAAGRTYGITLGAHF
ncbi:MAG TPA: TonB-dependent receptor [Steroidobacteraceae bacterium]|nr:TonB-dependent receptor [Steroidobacteraceae bacterium]